MAERLDHFAKMRAEQEPTSQPPADAPAFSLEQLEWLETQYPRQDAVIGFTQDGMVEATAQNAFWGGAQHVLKHIRTLVRGS
jgi:hypothetical protein